MQSGYSNFLSFLPTPSRFNLLLLEEGEFLFEEYAAVLYLHGPGQPSELGGGGAHRGRLRVCSRGLSFEPDDQRLHIFKFPLKHMPRRPQVLSSLPASPLATELCGLLAADSLSPHDTLVCQPSQVVLMKASGSVAPYLERQCGAQPEGGAKGGKGQRGSAAAPAAAAAAAAASTPLLAANTMTLLLVLSHTPAVEVAPEVAQLWDIQQGSLDSASGRERSKLEPLVAARRRGPFNLSLLADYRERTLTPNSPAPTAERVFPLVSCPGRIAVTASALYFEPVAVNNPSGSDPVQKWALRDIARVLRRPRLQRAVGLELLLVQGARGSGTVGGTDLSAAGLSADHPAAQTVFFAFDSPGDREEVYSKLLEALQGWRLANGGGEEAQAQAELGDPAPAAILQATLAWQARSLSNLDYLLALNSFAGRSRADLTAYPVLPWVLADYTSPTLDLDSPASFRDLSKPVGALNAARLEAFRARFADMPREEGCDPPFLYGTHYSTPGYCLYFLARCMPEHMLQLQSGRFDAPDRMFYDIAATWAGVTGTNSDLKELTPDFYSGDGGFLTLPDGLNLGVRSSGRRLGDVGLPPWAYDASDFVAQMRGALECEHVSAHLHAWVDLVFGALQRGAAAVGADNLFYYLTYEGAVDMESITDPDKRASTQAQISEFGQTPKQLFARPHPRRGDPPAPQYGLGEAQQQQEEEEVGGQQQGEEEARGGGGAMTVPVAAEGSQGASAGAVAEETAAAAAPTEAAQSEGQAEEEGGPAEAESPHAGSSSSSSSSSSSTAALLTLPAASHELATGSAATHLSLLEWQLLPSAHASPAHSQQVSGLAALALPHHPLAQQLLLTAGSDGAVTVQSASGHHHHHHLTPLFTGRPAPAPAQQQPAAAARPTSTATLHAALYGDDCPLPLRACALDAAAGTAFVGSIGGMVHALPLGGLLQGLAAGDAPPSFAALPTPAPSALLCLAARTVQLPGSSGSLTLLFAGASDGCLYVWQWRKAAAAFSAAPVAALLTPLASGGGSSSAAAAAAAAATPITSCALVLSPSAPLAPSLSLLVALGDASGTVGVCSVSVAVCEGGVEGGLPVDPADGASAAAAAAASASTATVAFAGSSKSSVTVLKSSAAQCDPLSRGDLFTGSCSGVTGCLWVPGMPAAGSSSSSSSSSSSDVRRLVTSGSDGRLAIWSMHSASGALAGPLQPLALIASGAVVRCLAGLQGGGGVAQVVTCGNAGGEVRVWALGGVWERVLGAQGGAGAKLPLQLCTAEVAVCSLPLVGVEASEEGEGGAEASPRQQLPPLTALCLWECPQGGVRIVAGSRAGSLHAWMGSAPAGGTE